MKLKNSTRLLVHILITVFVFPSFGQSNKVDQRLPPNGSPINSQIGMATKKPEVRPVDSYAAGRLLYKNGKYHEAIIELQKAYEQVPLPTLLRNIGMAYKKINMKQEACDYFLRYLQEADTIEKADREEISQAISELRLAMANEKRPDSVSIEARVSRQHPGQASKPVIIPTMDQRNREPPLLPQSPTILAASLSDAGPSVPKSTANADIKAVDAKTDSGADCSVDPDSNYYQMGRKLYKEGQFERSIECLKLANQQKPRPLLIYNIGMAYRKLNRHFESIAYFQRFLSTADTLTEDERLRVQAFIDQSAKAKISGQIITADPQISRLDPGQDEKQPLYKKWWFWTIVGGTAVAVGIAIAVPIIVQQNSRDFCTTYSGSVDLCATATASNLAIMF